MKKAVTTNDKDVFNLVLTSLRINGYVKLDAKKYTDATGKDCYYIVMERVNDMIYKIFGV
jgi:hypothetical protein